MSQSQSQRVGDEELELIQISVPVNAHECQAGTGNGPANAISVGHSIPLSATSPLATAAISYRGLNLTTCGAKRRVPAVSQCILDH